MLVVNAFSTGEGVARRGHDARHRLASDSFRGSWSVSVVVQVHCVQCAQLRSRTVTALKSRWLKMAQSGMVEPADLAYWDGSCHVCFSGEVNPDNQMLTCADCGTLVHQSVFSELFVPCTTKILYLHSLLLCVAHARAAVALHVLCISPRFEQGVESSQVHFVRHPGRRIQTDGRGQRMGPCGVCPMDSRARYEWHSVLWLGLIFVSR